MPAREQQKGASKTFKKIQRSFKWIFKLEKLFEHFTEYFFKDITMILHVHMVPTYAQVFVNLNIFPKFCKGEVVVKSLQSA